MSGEIPGYRPDEVVKQGSRIITDPELAHIGADKEKKKREQGRIANLLDTTPEYTLGRSNEELLEMARDEDTNEAMAKEIYKRALNDYISNGDTKERAKLLAEDAKAAFLKRLSEK